jgi:hypothetical protein
MSNKLSEMSTDSQEKEKIAIDVGGVLIEKKNRYGADTNFDLDNVQWVPGALDAVKKLTELYDVYILSFCGKKTEWETRQALKKEVLPYIPEEKWIFTREREYKVDRMKEHNITTLVDDTLEIIKWVENAGMKGVHFRSPWYPDWNSVVKLLSE